MLDEALFPPKMGYVVFFPSSRLFPEFISLCLLQPLGFASSRFEGVVCVMGASCELEFSGSLLLSFIDSEKGAVPKQKKANIHYFTTPNGATISSLTSPSSNPPLYQRLALEEH